MRITPRNEPVDVLYRIKRGLAGYISYLAACQMNDAFSEYVLYEPILRILTARGFKANCEVTCPGIEHAATGDRKRIDFIAKRKGVHLALEVKWAKATYIDVESDRTKLAAFKRQYVSANAYLCVFGRKAHIENVSWKSKKDFKQKGRIICADLKSTRYGCRIFELLTFSESIASPCRSGESKHREGPKAK